MSTSGELNSVAGVPQEEEEELANIPLVRRAPATTAAQAKKKSANNDDDNEFDLGISYVPANKREKMGTGGGGGGFGTSFASSSSSVGARRLLDGMGGAATATAGGVALDADPSSAALPDDTDHPQDIKEHALWKERMRKLTESLKATTPS